MKISVFGIISWALNPNNEPTIVPSKIKIILK